MTWGKMDDKAHRNKKVRKLYRMGAKGREAYGVWTFRWSWCLDDPDLSGIVPADELDPAELKAAELLCSDLHEGRGLWERVPGGFRFHDFHEYNPTKEQVESKRKYDRQRKKPERTPNPRGVVTESERNPRGVVTESERNPRGVVTESERNPRGVVTESERNPRGIRGESFPTRASHTQPIPNPYPTESENLRARARGPASPPEPDPEPDPPEVRPEPPDPGPEPPEPEFEPGEPRPEVASEAMIRREFSKRLCRSTGSVLAYGPKIDGNIRALARWLDEQAGGHGATETGRKNVLKRLLDGFFADAWAQTASYPLTDLTNRPEKYFTPPKRDARKGFMEPAPESAFTGPELSPDELFGPLIEPEPARSRRA